MRRVTHTVRSSRRLSRLWHALPPFTSPPGARTSQYEGRSVAPRQLSHEVTADCPVTTSPHHTIVVTNPLRVSAMYSTAVAPAPSPRSSSNHPHLAARLSPFCTIIMSRPAHPRSSRERVVAGPYHTLAASPRRLPSSRSSPIQRVHMVEPKLHRPGCHTRCTPLISSSHRRYGSPSCVVHTRRQCTARPRGIPSPCRHVSVLRRSASRFRRSCPISPLALALASYTRGSHIGLLDKSR